MVEGMELQLPSLPVVLLTSLIIFLFTIIITKLSSFSSSKLPPGPWKLPIIGSLHHLTGSSLHRRLRDLANKHGPLMHLKLGQIPTIVVSSPEMAREVIKTHDLIFSNRPQLLTLKYVTYNYADMAFSPYGDYWRRIKKICILELLSAKRVRSFLSIREEEVNDLMRSIISAGATTLVDLSEKLNLLSNNITARAAFGNRSKHQERFLSIVKETIQLTRGLQFCDLFPSLEFLFMFTRMKHRMESTQQKLDKIIDEIIEEHRKRFETNTEKRRKLMQQSGEEEEEEDGELQEDLVDVLLRIQREGDPDFPLSPTNVKGIILDMFIAGTETSATTLEWIMSELMKKPSIMEKVQVEVRKVYDGKRKLDESVIGEMSYLKRVINENFRLHPPLPLLLPRESTQRCEINGYEVPMKTRLLLNAWAIGRDPKHWTNPESFDPERFRDSPIDYKGTSFELLAFGAGRRMCPGMSFGLSTVETTLVKLLYHFNWQLPDGLKPQDLDMTESFGLSMARKSHLCLLASPAIPL